MNSVLYHERNTLDYFFEDKRRKYKASDWFINQVLVNLDSRLFNQGEVIQAKDDRVRDLIFISQGTCKLYGFLKTGEGESKK